MPPVPVVVWSDYVCPWCYIGQGELKSLEKEFSFEVDWRPFMLRPDAPEEGWELPEAFKKRRGTAQDVLGQRAKALGLALVEPDVVPPTRRAHQATEFAREHGKLELFHQELLERHWSRSQNINDGKVLEEAAVVAGLDPLVLRAALADGRYTDRVQQSIEEAHALGVDGVPAFVLGNRFAISGAQPAAVFRQVFERLAKGL